MHTHGHCRITRCSISWSSSPRQIRVFGAILGIPALAVHRHFDARSCECSYSPNDSPGQPARLGLSNEVALRSWHRAPSNAAFSAPASPLHRACTSTRDPVARSEWHGRRRAGLLPQEKLHMCVCGTFCDSMNPDLSRLESPRQNNVHAALHRLHHGRAHLHHHHHRDHQVLGIIVMLMMIATASDKTIIMMMAFL